MSTSVNEGDRVRAERAEAEVGRLTARLAEVEAERDKARAALADPCSVLGHAVDMSEFSSRGQCTRCGSVFEFPAEAPTTPRDDATTRYFKYPLFLKATGA